MSDGFGDGVEYGIRHVLGLMTRVESNRSFVVFRKQLLLDNRTRPLFLEHEEAKKKAKLEQEKLL